MATKPIKSAKATSGVKVTTGNKSTSITKNRVRVRKQNAKMPKVN
jgi:hypothetical protein